MKKYSVKVTETYQRDIVVEAENQEQANTRVRDAWKNTEFALENDDFKGVEFWLNGEVESGVLSEIDKKDAMSTQNESKRTLYKKN